MKQTAAPGCVVQNSTLNGSWEFSGDQVTFHDDNPFGCPADFTYKWSLAEDELRFTEAEEKDECISRVIYMTKHPWVYEK